MTILASIQHQSFLPDLVIYLQETHPTEDVILMIDESQAFRTDQYDLSLFFSTVLKFNSNEIIKLEDEQQIELAINNTINGLINSAGIDLNDVNEFLLSSDTVNLMGIYLSMKGIPYKIQDIVPKQNLEKTRYMTLKQIASKAFIDLQVKYGVLCGEGHTVIEYGAEGYDYCGVFNNMNKEDQIKLLCLFGLQSTRYDSYDEIVIMNSRGYLLGNPNIKNDVDIVDCYSVLMDYFGHSSNRIIKIHPGDNKYISFPNNAVDDYSFSIELLAPFLHGKEMMCIASTSAKKTPELKWTEVGVEFLSIYDRFFFIDTGIVLAKYLGYDKIFVDIKDVTLRRALESLYGVYIVELDECQFAITYDSINTGKINYYLNGKNDATSFRIISDKKGNHQEIEAHVKSLGFIKLVKTWFFKYSKVCPNQDATITMVYKRKSQ